MGYFDAVSAGFRNYFDFQGRATRPEFWWFFLFTILLSLGTAVADMSLGFGSDTMAGPINTIAGLAVLIPALSLGTRRLHDIGRSGWWQLLAILPIGGTVAITSGDMVSPVPIVLISLVGSILLIYWWCQPSKSY
jgi:uncharacterized membrane protein YhaH (DUF805 family)